MGGRRSGRQWPRLRLAAARCEGAWRYVFGIAIRHGTGLRVGLVLHRVGSRLFCLGDRRLALLPWCFRIDFFWLHRAFPIVADYSR